MKTFDLDEFIMHHIQNSYEWHLPFLPPIHLPSFLSLHGVMLLICAVGLVIIFCFLYRTNGKAPSGLTNFLEIIILHIRDEMAINNLGEEQGKKMTPLFCTFFFFILGLNLMGLIPIFSTATANVSVTAGMALATFTFMVFGAIYQNGPVKFFKAFMPSGVPFPILIVLIPIEIAGLFIKTFALMIRLFANMFAGHVVILSMLGIVVAVGYVAALPAVIMAVFISFLEILVAFLQAYVFTFLSAIFIGQTYHPEH